MFDIACLFRVDDFPPSWVSGLFFQLLLSNTLWCSSIAGAKVPVNTFNVIWCSAAWQRYLSSKYFLTFVGTWERKSKENAIEFIAPPYAHFYYRNSQFMIVCFTHPEIPSSQTHILLFTPQHLIFTPSSFLKDFFFIEKSIFNAFSRWKKELEIDDVSIKEMKN